ncbi:HalOD1 output domain-containing protein [Halovivax limisalsi]|uniref:HalOD1 output domain-containing protein n=1 Tax=Halovivax limisalsi TaxID=1453760 RepID=UPI001FFC38DE|nr:HalOD1 output domain-containing protein [Halovivax limisalsi]
MTVAIVRAVASEKEVDPVDLSPPLDTVIDADALNDLFKAPKKSAGRVCFEYSGCRIQVLADGTVEVEPAEAAADFSR